MGIYRLYSDSDGESHLEELDLAANPELAQAQSTNSITFREWPAGHFIDRHPAPHRQYVIALSGHVGIGLGDGTTVRYNPGDARLVEYTTGRGHTTRLTDEQSGDQPCIHAVIPLAE